MRLQTKVPGKPHLLWLCTPSPFMSREAEREWLAIMPNGSVLPLLGEVSQIGEQLDDMARRRLFGMGKPQTEF